MLMKIKTAGGFLTAKKKKRKKVTSADRLQFFRPLVSLRNITKHCQGPRETS